MMSDGVSRSSAGDQGDPSSGRLKHAEHVKSIDEAHSENMHKATDFCAPHEILFVMASCSLMPISPARSPTTRAKVEALVASVMLSRQRRTLMIPTIQSCGEVLNTS